MNKKIYIITIFCLFLGIFLSQKCYAKYVLGGNLDMNVYIDKTPPVIDLINNGKTEKFPQTQPDIIKRTEDTKIDTSDNIKIDHNEIRYNPSENKFDDKEPVNFDNGKTITDEGFYEITAIDTSGNTTKIVVLIDKSAPEVTVKFHKKNEISNLEFKNTNDVFRNGGALC